MQGNCGRYIKEIHITHEEILKNIDEKQKDMSDALEAERKKILETFEEKIREIQD
jgi:hypothetical protein